MIWQPSNYSSYLRKGFWVPFSTPKVVCGFITSVSKVYHNLSGGRDPSFWHPPGPGGCTRRLPRACFPPGPMAPEEQQPSFIRRILLPPSSIAVCLWGLFAQETDVNVNPAWPGDAISAHGFRRQVTWSNRWSPLRGRRSPAPTVHFMANPRVIGQPVNCSTQWSLKTPWVISSWINGLDFFTGLRNGWGGKDHHVSRRHPPFQGSK